MSVIAQHTHIFHSATSQNSSSFQQSNMIREWCRQQCSRESFRGTVSVLGIVAALLCGMLVIGTGVEFYEQRSAGYVTGTCESTIDTILLLYHFNETHHQCLLPTTPFSVPLSPLQAWHDGSEIGQTKTRYGTSEAASERRRRWNASYDLVDSTLPRGWVVQICSARHISLSLRAANMAQAALEKTACQDKPELVRHVQWECVAELSPGDVSIHDAQRLLLSHSLPSLSESTTGISRIDSIMIGHRKRPLTPFPNGTRPTVSAWKTKGSEICRFASGQEWQLEHRYDYVWNRTATEACWIGPDGDIVPMWQMATYLFTPQF
jgi:hypothetical protein